MFVVASETTLLLMALISISCLPSMLLSGSCPKKQGSEKDLSLIRQKNPTSKSKEDFTSHSDFLQILERSMEVCELKKINFLYTSLQKPVVNISPK